MISLIPIGTLIIATTVAAVVSSTSSSGPSDSYQNAYRALPKDMLVFGQLMFTRLSQSQIEQVRVSPKEAARIARDYYGIKEPWRVVFESLGGYVNDAQIIHDWVGTRSLIPKALPAYVVRVTGVPIESLGLGGAVNHYWNVIVNAMTGHVVSSFTYD